MNFQKLFILASLLSVSQHMFSEQKIISLQCPLLKVADNAGIFHGPIIDILQTRIDIVKLIQGEQKWSGAIINLNVENSNKTITIYMQRPEIIYGATFVVLAPDHELVEHITTPEHEQQVKTFFQEKMKPVAGVTVTHPSLYERQLNATTEAMFTGAYALHPLTQERLPIYISDYAVECFDVRKSKARLGVPAHNSKDFEFAGIYNLPIKVVVDVQSNLKGKKDDFGPVVAAPLFDKNDNLIEAYLGEYAPCIIINSQMLNNASLKDAAAHVIDYLQKYNLGKAHTEALLYDYNGQQYSVKDLAKIEAALYKNAAHTAQVEALKKELKTALIYIQADFLAICEKFFINIKNTKSLMIALIEEDCQLRQNNNSYLLQWAVQWANSKGEFNAKDLFRKDITLIKNFTLFCKDLVNFLGDLAHSCPKALDNIRKQNQ